MLGVNHQGSTSRDSVPLKSTRVWDRTDDLKSALTQVLAYPDITPEIGLNRIFALGLSMGGATALHLAGTQMDRKLYRKYCARMGSDAADCSFFTEGGVDISTLPDEWESDMHDLRISKVIAIDPGFSRAMAQQGLAAVTAPTLIIRLGTTGKQWQAMGAGLAGSDLAARLLHGHGIQIAPAFHDTFLAECS